MRAFARCLLVLTMLAVTQGCSKKSEPLVSVSSSTLEVNASIVPQFKNVKSDECRLEGMVTVKNITAAPRKFGTSYLVLKVNGNLGARTFKNVSSPEAIDLSAVEIRPDDSLSFSAYWQFMTPENTKIKSLQLILTEPE
jgi:hypothetical protein